MTSSNPPICEGGAVEEKLVKRELCVEPGGLFLGKLLIKGRGLRLTLTMFLRVLIDIKTSMKLFLALTKNSLIVIY